MRIDAYTHFIPEKFFAKLVDSGYADIGKRVREIPCIHDLDVAQEGRRHVQGLCADPVLSDAADRVARPRASRSTNTAKLVNDGFVDICAKNPDHFPGWVAEAADRRARRRRARSRTRDQERRARRADPHQYRRQAARRARVRAVLGDHEQAQQADLAASGARRQFPGLCSPRKNRNTKSGGPSAGPTRPRRRWRGWCSPRSWTSTRT